MKWKEIEFKFLDYNYLAVYALGAVVLSMSVFIEWWFILVVPGIIIGVCIVPLSAILIGIIARFTVKFLIWMFLNKLFLKQIYKWIKR